MHLISYLMSFYDTKIGPSGKYETSVSNSPKSGQVPSVTGNLSSNILEFTASLSSFVEILANFSESFFTSSSSF